MSQFQSLIDLQPKSVDGKSLVPVIIKALQDMQNKFTEEIESVKRSFMEVCSEKDKKISDLSLEVDSLKRKAEKMEDQIDESDQYERRDTLIISGDSLPESSSDEDCTRIICQAVQEKLNYIVSPTEISVAHRLGPKSSSQRPDKRKIIAKFCRRNTKKDLLAAARRVKPNNLYINESLTAQRQTICFALRKAKKDYPNKISGVSTVDGRVFVWVKPPNAQDRAPRFQVNSFLALEDFCQRTLGVAKDRFLR